MKMQLLFVILFITIFSIVISQNAYGSLSLDKGEYTWTDKVKIRLMVHGFDHKQDTIQVSVGDNELRSYKLSKTGNGLYTGEIILTGFSYDVDGDGKSDTRPRTTGNGPNNGFLESIHEENLKLSVRFQDGTKMETTARITWNVGEISFDMSNHQLDKIAKLQAIDRDMNLNPETLDKLPIHVFSDSDKAGILVDAIETEEESGIFETTISFTQNSSSNGNRLFATSGDVIYAQYIDHTLPKPYNIHDDLEIVAKSIVLDSLIAEPEQDKPITENCGSGTIFEDGICVENSKENQDNSVHLEGPEYNVGSPLKQHKMGVKFDEIRCKDNFEIIGKMPYAHPKCVKPESVEKLVIRGWATTNKTIELENPIPYTVTKNNNFFEILYSLKGATLESIAHDTDSNSIQVSLSGAVGGYLVISIPRDLIDAKMGDNNDDMYFLLIDRVEHMYGEKISDYSRIITVWFAKDTSNIEIIGTFWI